MDEEENKSCDGGFHSLVFGWGRDGIFSDAEANKFNKVKGISSPKKCESVMKNLGLCLLCAYLRPAVAASTLCPSVPQQAIYTSLIRHFILKSIRLPRRVVALRRLSF